MRAEISAWSTLTPITRSHQKFSIHRSLHVLAPITLSAFSVFGRHVRLAELTLVVRSTAQRFNSQRTMNFTHRASGLLSNGTDLVRPSLRTHKSIRPLIRALIRAPE